MSTSQTITKNDLEAILGGLVEAQETVGVISPDFTTTDVTNPLGVLADGSAVVFGKVCQLTLGVKHISAVSVGGNVFHKKLTTDVILPRQLINGVGYYGSSCGIAQLTPSGDLTVRITGAQLAANSTIYISMIYIIGD